MDLNTFYDEYHRVTKERRIEGLKALFDELLSDINRYDALLQEIVWTAAQSEDDDVFGTEGLNV